jgi:hypothetical protein
MIHHRVCTSGEPSYSVTTTIMIHHLPPYASHCLSPWLSPAIAITRLYNTHHPLSGKSTEARSLGGVEWGRWRTASNNTTLVYMDIYFTSSYPCSSCWTVEVDSFMKFRNETPKKFSDGILKQRSFFVKGRGRSDHEGS